MAMMNDPLAKAVKLQQQGKLPEAAKCYQLALLSDPALDVACGNLGLIYLQMDQAELAIPRLVMAIKVQPCVHHYHYHLAEAYYATDKVDLAINAYQQAIGLSPDIADYHFSLGNALTEAGDQINAIKAYKKALALAPDDTEALNNLANNLADIGLIDEARQRLQEALVIKPDYAEAHVNLAHLHLETGDLIRAIDLCKKAVLIKPDLFEAHLDLGRWLAREPTTLQQALLSFQLALHLRPDSVAAKQGLADSLLKLDLPRDAVPFYREIVSATAHARDFLGLSHCLIRLQQFPEAEQLAKKVIELSPDLAEAYVNLGICLQTRGRFKAAKSAHSEALNRNPKLTDAAYHLALLDPDAASSPGFQQAIRYLNEQQLPPEKQAHLHFARGKLAEREARYKQAFEHFQSGNAIKSARYPFDEVRYQAYIERIIHTFSSNFFKQHSSFGLSTESPVFIVGMPRSGSTLLEQILNSHPAIQGIGEHREMRDIMRKLPQQIASKRLVPECIAEISAPQSRVLARRYLDSLPKTDKDTARIVDKMLGNFLRLGMIALLFPNARIIHCQREALDTCLSCYTQDFAAGLRFTTRLSHLGAVYKSHLKLMAHWERVLPMKITRINYEDLVSNTEACTRQLIDFCGLSWDPACLQHSITKSNVATASFLQARQPVYGKSVGRWQHYGDWLAELKQALE